MFGRLVFVTAFLLPCTCHKVDSPIPPTILKIICEFASVQSIEDDVAAEVCDEVTKLFPTLKFDPDCKTVVEELWDTGLALFCPQPGTELALPVKVQEKPTGPLPDWMEKIICELTSAKEVEDGITGGVCNEVTKLFPSIKFDPDCQTVLEDLWDAGHA